MPRYIRITAYIGNGILTFLCAALLLYASSRGEAGPAITVALVFLLGCLNLYILIKSSPSSEEEWLVREVRKAEMRRQLVELASQGLTDVVPPDVMAKHKADETSRRSDLPDHPQR